MPEIKMKLKCRNCNEVLAADAQFCHECGTSVSAAHAELCPQCKSSVESGWAVCPSCGEPLSEEKKQERLRREENELAAQSKALEEGKQSKLEDKLKSTSDGLSGQSKIAISAAVALVLILIWSQLANKGKESKPIIPAPPAQQASIIASTYQTPIKKKADSLIYTDPQTGLQWLRDGNVAGKTMKWAEAMEWVKTLDIGGYHDWRLPTKDEIKVFVKRGGGTPYVWFRENGFRNVGVYYWSSSSEARSNDAWLMCVGGGSLALDYRSGGNHVWPVRGGL